MARIRQLKPEFFLHEGLGGLSMAHRLLFAGLWCIADKAGRLEDRPRRICCQVFPYDFGIDCDALLQDLEGIGCVLRYEVDGRRFVSIPSWPKHQHPHVKEPDSRIPAPYAEKPGANPVHDSALPVTGTDSAPPPHLSRPSESGVRNLESGSKTPPNPPRKIEGGLKAGEIDPATGFPILTPEQQRAMDETLVFRSQMEAAFEPVLLQVRNYWRMRTDRADAVIGKLLRKRIWERYLEGAKGQEMNQAIDAYCHAHRGQTLGLGLRNIFRSTDSFEKWRCAPRPIALPTSAPIQWPPPGGLLDGMRLLQAEGMAGEIILKMLSNLEPVEDTAEKLTLKGPPFTVDQLIERQVDLELTQVLKRPVAFVGDGTVFHKAQGVASQIGLCQ